MADGTQAAIVSVVPRTDAEPVYNLEVDGEHVYCVSHAGVLVHNMCATNRGPALGNSAKFREGWQRNFGARDEWHHLLPQGKKLRHFFKRAGLDIEDFKVALDKAKHRLKPDSLHTNGAGNWIRVWKQFFEKNPNAMKADILAQLARMRRQFGI